jgi:hypothetical protein
MSQEHLDTEVVNMTAFITYCNFGSTGSLEAITAGIDELVPHQPRLGRINHFYIQIKGTTKFQ